MYSYYPIKIETRIVNPELKYLNADLYTTDTNTPKPIILIQTPYNKDLYRGWENGTAFRNSIILDSINYNYVMMDWRGFFSNKNVDTLGYNRGLDGYDAVEWIAARKWCNGKVGTWGGSALGMIQFQTAKENPPHLVCAAPYIKDFLTKYEDYYYGGVYRKEHVQALVKLGFTTEQLILSHPMKDGLWRSIELLNNTAKSIKVPMLMATGWFDHFPEGVIRAFEDIQKQSENSVRDKHKLLVGPWLHMEMGKSQQGIWNFPNAEKEDERMGKMFFDYYLLNAKNGYPLKPKATFYEMGTNQWIFDDNWKGINRSYDTLYINADGKLLVTPPPPKMGPLGDPPDTLIYNPKEPSPSYGGARFVPFDFSVKTGPQDISEIVEGRDDNLLYTSEIQDEPIKINGSVLIQLFAGSDRKDTDFAVRLTEVTADGQSVILTQGIKRMRFRETLESEVFMEKDSIYYVEIELEPLNIQLAKDSRLRIVVTSSNYPMFDINLNNGDELYQPGDTLTAANLIYRRSEAASRVVIPVIDPPTGFVFETLVEDKINVYPNPASEYFYVRGKNRILSYELYDVLGNKVMSDEYSGIVNISNVSPGYYFVKTYLSNNDVELTRVVVSR